MAGRPPVSSARRGELLDACYAYILEHGLAGVSLRPLAAATGTSPRVLLYLFGSKDRLFRQLLAKTRREQVEQMAAALEQDAVDPSVPFEVVTQRLWTWLSAPQQRHMVRLTYEAFLRSLGRDPGPWEGFAAESARDWLALLISAQPDTPAQIAEARATRALAIIRGLLLDLLACGDHPRVTAAIKQGW